eukprot:COSAG01_NODE_373_length_17991_cov_284.890075_25_plen_79_part_00
MRVAHCVDCQVTLGAAAGLLTVHGCERSAVAACARAMVLSSCIDVQLHTMLASPMLCVGDCREVRPLRRDNSMIGSSD